MTRYNRKWIRRIWQHHRAAKLDERKQPTSFRACLRATAALLLNRWDGDISFGDGQEVAWRSDGYYMTDYGEGKAFTSLEVVGLRVNEFSDGTL